MPNLPVARSMLTTARYRGLVAVVVGRCYANGAWLYDLRLPNHKIVININERDLIDA